MDQAQIDYVREQLKRGATREQLRGVLAENGYSYELIAELFNEVGDIKPDAPKTVASVYKKKNTELKQPVGTTSASRFAVSLKKIFFTLVGLTFLVIWAGAAYYFWFDIQDFFSGPRDEIKKLVVLQLPSQATEYFETNGSFASFCDSPTNAKARRDLDGNLDCVDGVGGFAVTTELVNGDTYCVDTNRFSGVVSGDRFEESFCAGNMPEPTAANASGDIDMGASLEEMDADIIVQIDALAAAAEVFYKTNDSYETFCETSELVSSARDRLPEATRLDCWSNEVAYYLSGYVTENKVYGVGVGGTRSISDDSVFSFF